MAWSYHSSPDYRVTTARYFGAIGYSRDVAQLQAFGREMRRHMRPTGIYHSLGGAGVLLGVVGLLMDGQGTPEPVEVGDGRYRIAVIGRPYRPWYLRELLGQMRRLSLLSVSVVIADTGRETEAELVWDSITETLDASVTTPAAQVGGAVLSATEGVGSAAEGLGDGLPELGEGVGDALEGIGDAARSLGEGTRTLGAASRYAPTLFTLALIAGGVWLVKTGTIKIAPIKVGGR